MELKKAVKLFMIFDILGDTQRSGPLLWKIERKRLEDVKNHIMDLIIMARILRKHLPSTLDYDKLDEYIVCHDLPEAITGDITKFEGVSGEEIKRVTDEAIEYLEENFGDLMNFKTVINKFDAQEDLEAKIAHLLDKAHSSSTFIKYQSEKNINMDNPEIIELLRNHPFVVQKKAEGSDLADIFYEYHSMSIKITDEECQKYNISREVGDSIVSVIKGFLNEMIRQKNSGTLLDVKGKFPKSAMDYNQDK